MPFHATLSRLFCLLPLSTVVLADEGMWTFDNFPSDAVAQKYGVEIGEDWLSAARLATTRLENGCTGSFASGDGLVLTNNHCVWGCVRNLSSAERNLSDEGFLARTRDEELRCPGQQVSVLVAFEDVTEAVRAAAKDLDDAAANEARKARLTQLESACEASSPGHRCEAVTLYNGGQYFIYEYQRYDDVRLVFAPELDIAAFGGDPDNFNFPRWCLDMSFLRAYEDGQPASTPNHLRWRPDGPASGEAVFISGHPGSTSRSLTVAELRMLREVEYPNWLLRYAELRGRMIEWGKTGSEAARIVQQRLLGIENGIKVRRNQLSALLDPQSMAQKMEAEAALRKAVGADPQLQAAYGDAWSLIDGAMETYRNMYLEYLFIEAGAGLQGELFGFARTLVRGAGERELANEKRLREFTDAALPGLEQRLFASRPIDPGYEKLRLAFSLAKLREWLGPDSRFVKLVMGDDSPEALAQRLVDTTTLADADVRRALWEGGVKAVSSSDDPLIRLARAIEPEARALRKRYDEEVEAPKVRGQEMLADARFAIYGTDTYPDATFTLRATYGAVEGWTEQGQEVAPFTRTERLYERATGQRPFLLPASWAGARELLDMQTPFNFVATTDITGGNSGSPIIASDGSLVGLAFDGNIHSIAGDFLFDQRVNRTVGVNTAIMLEALSTVYGADHLVEELTLTTASP
jgi:hypothetical protein